MSARLREGAARLALVLGSSALALVLAEAGVRLSGWEPAAHRPPLRVFDDARQLLLDCYPDDPRGYFDLDLRDPALLARYRGLGLRRIERAAGRAPHCVEVRYNSQRFRGGEVPQRRAGVWRVGVLGDSFSEGQGVREDDSWPRRLEQELAEMEPGRFEVINGSHRAADFPELHEMFYRLLVDDPDIAIYAMVMNDVEQTPAFRESQRAVSDWITLQGRAARGRYRRLGALDSRLLFLVRERLAARRIASASSQWYRDMYSEPNAAGWAATRERIVEMDRRMRQRDGRLLVLRWPLLAGFPGVYPFEETHREIGHFLDAAGIASVDLLPALSQERVEELVVAAADHHPNERAHAIAARRVAPVVRQLAGELPGSRRLRVEQGAWQPDPQ